MAKQIAPRLASGECRVPSYGGLPPWIKEALAEGARIEGKSVSWIKEEIIIEWMETQGRRFRRPRYVKPKAAVVRKRIGGRVLHMPKRRAS
jgi:hypothetical protein